MSTGRVFVVVCFLASFVRAQATEIVEMPVDELADRIHGGVLGQMLGNLNGLRPFAGEHRHSHRELAVPRYAERYRTDHA
jgi:hypothetical protein